MLKIIIADDHTIVRQGVKQLLLDEFPAAHVSEAEDTAGLLEEVMGQSWDLVISDLVMPNGSMFDAIKQIKKSNTALPIIIISTHPAEQYASRVLKAGADDFISKDSLPLSLINSIRQLLGGQMGDRRLQV